MSQGKLEIAVSTRTTGKGDCRTMRKDGFIPAMVYGRKFDNKNIKIDARLVTKYATREYESSLFTLRCEDDKKVDGQAVLFKSVVRHPATRKYQHVDFYAVDLTETVKVKVEVRFEGSPAGVKEGGVFQPTLREIEIESLPNAIPEFLPVDVSNLAIGEALHVSNISLPEGVKAVTVATQTLCTVTQAKVSTEPATTEEAAAEPAAEGEENKS